MSYQLEIERHLRSLPALQPAGRVMAFGAVSGFRAHPAGGRTGRGSAFDDTRQSCPFGLGEVDTEVQRSLIFRLLLIADSEFEEGAVGGCAERRAIDDDAQIRIGSNDIDGVLAGFVAGIIISQRNGFYDFGLVCDLSERLAIGNIGDNNEACRLIGFDLSTHET